MASVTGSQHGTSTTSVHALVAKAVAGTKVVGVSSLVLTSSAHDTVPGGSSSFDSSVGGTEAISFAGKSAGADKGVTSQTVHKDGVTVNFSDGSAITVVGITHLSTAFTHH
jgi:hypothetical protein